MATDARQPIDGDLDNGDFREEMSEVEREAEGGMRATEPGHVGVERMQEWIDEAQDLEGHTASGSDGRKHTSADAGFEGDLAPEGWTGAELDRRRRAAKRAETARHPPAEFYREAEGA